jgi:hypothetical protein
MAIGEDLKRVSRSYRHAASRLADARGKQRAE